MTVEDSRKAYVALDGRAVLIPTSSRHLAPRRRRRREPAETVERMQIAHPHASRDVAPWKNPMEKNPRRERTANDRDHSGPLIERGGARRKHPDRRRVNSSDRAPQNAVAKPRGVACRTPHASHNRQPTPERINPLFVGLRRARGGAVWFGRVPSARPCRESRESRVDGGPILRASMYLPTSCDVRLVCRRHSESHSHSQVRTCTVHGTRRRRYASLSTQSAVVSLRKVRSDVP